MADVIKKSTNKFTKGIVMDFSPENTKNEVLTHALNATLLTFNGNELSLQNDMGNARVETAYLPEGYIPVGTCEYGGIIYIVSYNPLEDKSQIGCFPSPERNVSNDELGKSDAVLKKADFQYLIDELYPSGKIKNNSQYVLLKENHLNPGDKFLVCADDAIFEESLTDLYKQNGENTEPIANPVLSLNVVSIEDSGKIVYLNSDLRQYQVNKNGDKFSYHILGQHSNGAKFDQASVDIDSYRNAVSSGYNVFKSKTSGRLALLAELVMIDSYAVTHSLRPTKDAEGNTIPGQFDVFIHTEVSPNLTVSNFATAPKLSYYYLPESQGYLQRITSEVGSGETEQVPLFSKSENSDWGFNSDFFNTDLTKVYSATIPDFQISGKVSDSGNFGFYFPDTYSGTMVKYTGDLNTTHALYLKVLANHYYRIDASQVDSVKCLKCKLYIYNTEVKYSEISVDDVNKYAMEQLFFSPYQDLYLPTTTFIPNVQYNYLDGYVTPTDMRDGESAISIYYLSDFIPQNTGSGITQYEDFKLGHITLPKIAVDNDLDFPFKYKYTLIPCMNYGKLEHLAISNTVDFSQLHAFDRSQFNTWKYHIDGNQLRVTFGAEIFDTYEDDKVDGLVLEFYDLWGFVGSLEITDKKSYSGVFTKILTLNSPNTLSTKRVVNSAYSTAYKHNIGITSDETTHWLGDREIFWDPVDGWYYGEDADGNKEGVENDCGTLYPNLMYGVKTYLRQKTADGSYKFTRKKDLFLFTLPIYNEFYYTTNDFTTLENPTLDFMLTYKLEDSSDVTLYTSDKITDGYITSLDYPTVSEYLDGRYQGTSLSGVCYYQYIGTSNLHLEIGLKQDYQHYNLSCLASINDLFSCKLQLVSNDNQDMTFDIKADLGDETLNYKSESGLVKQTNTLRFDGLHDTKSINKGEFQKYNFINNPNLQTIPIKYNFVVGYPFTIKDLRETQVKATTICALLHKNQLHQYNYEDFGIYQQVENEQTKYFSNALLYNSGTMYSYKFGVCKQVATNASEGIVTMADECRIIKEVVRTDPPGVYKAGLLNTGNDLRDVIPFIGKLTFCQPHAHGMSATECVNIYNHDNKLRIAPWDNWKFSVRDWSTETEWGNAAGGVPSDALYNNPMYNLSLNTLNSINLQSEFVSTIDYGVSKGYSYNWGAEYKYNRDRGWVKSPSTYNMREYTGFSGHQLSTFNKKLLKTMEQVYAYNPDYDSFSVYRGNVNIERTDVQFTSNLVAQDALLEFSDGKTLNDYVYLFNIKLSDYFELLQTYSGDGSGDIIQLRDVNNKFVPQIQFTPNCTYCGSVPYLLTSLVYNTSTPAALENSLNFDFNKDVVIKHYDGSISRISGVVDKNALYGFDKGTNRLIQLDVTNYQILEDGSLQLKQSVISEYPMDSIVSVMPLVNYSYIDETSQKYMVNSDYSSAQIRGTSLTLNDLRYRPDLEHRLFVRNNCWKSNESPNNLLMYRSTSAKYTWTTAKSDNTSDNRAYNSLYLLTGPCFTLSNLEHADYDDE